MGTKLGAASSVCLCWLFGPAPIALSDPFLPGISAWTRGEATVDPAASVPWFVRCFTPHHRSSAHPPCSCPCSASWPLASGGSSLSAPLHLCHAPFQTPGDLLPHLDLLVDAHPSAHLPAPLWCRPQTLVAHGPKALPLSLSCRGLVVQRFLQMCKKRCSWHCHAVLPEPKTGAPANPARWLTW